MRYCAYWIGSSTNLCLSELLFRQLRPSKWRLPMPRRNSSAWLWLVLHSTVSGKLCPRCFKCMCLPHRVGSPGQGAHMSATVSWQSGLRRLELMRLPGWPSISAVECCLLAAMPRKSSVQRLKPMCLSEWRSAAAERNHLCSAMPRKSNIQRLKPMRVPEWSVASSEQS